MLAPGFQRELVADVATELDADIGAGHVVVAGAVETADLHVFDRLGLNGKIGGLCSSDRNETCCRAEEKTFHHLHFCSSC